MSANSTSLLYATVTADWDAFVARGWPSPEGLLFGFKAVLVTHVITISYYLLRRTLLPFGKLHYKPQNDAPFVNRLMAHFSQPEGIFMVFSYLTGVWMFRICPDSYYDLESGVTPLNVVAQFLVVDFFIYLSHVLEHSVKWYYGKSHKSHHKYVRPRFLDAFSGSFFDTFSLILAPLFITMLLLPKLGIHVTDRDFACFGAIYTNQFMLIHMEFRNPWDPLLECFSIGTGIDHAVHHATFNYNYGHFFMIWDKLFGTYRHPSTVDGLWAEWDAEKKAAAFFERARERQKQNGHKIE